MSLNLAVKLHPLVVGQPCFVLCDVLYFPTWANESYRTINMEYCVRVVLPLLRLWDAKYTNKLPEVIPKYYIL